MGWEKTCSVEERTIVRRNRMASYISVRVRLHPQHQQYNCVLLASVAVRLTAGSWQDVIPPPSTLCLSKAKLTDWLVEWLADWLAD